MRIPNLGETELLVPLHDGAFEQPRWKTFLDRLRGVSGCDVAGLVLRPSGGIPTAHYSTRPGFEALRLHELFDRRSPAESAIADHWMREGRVYALGEILDAGGEEVRRLRKENLEAAELDHVRAVRVRDEGGVDAWLILAAREPISAAVSSSMAALAPHFRVALRVLSKLERERARASMSAGAFSHIDFGWISIDRQCRIVDRDEQADRFMSRSGTLREGPYGRLTPSSPAIDRQLSRLAKEFAQDSEARPRAINLSQDPWIDILVSPIRVEAISGDSKAVAVVYFRGEESSSADRCQQLIDVFNLTQSEARFAWSIAQGLSIAEAAGEHGLTIETARNYSKKIYSKTGAKGQVDFMRRVLTSVVALTVH